MVINEEKFIYQQLNYLKENGSLNKSYEKLMADLLVIKECLVSFFHFYFYLILRLFLIFHYGVCYYINSLI